MTTQPPFLFLEQVFQNLSKQLPQFPPPTWALEEIQRRIVLLLNHILRQEQEATARLARQKGRVVLFQWRHLSLKWVATPAGLLDCAPPDAAVDLTLSITEESPFTLIKGVLRGVKPAVRIHGDVQLAAEVNWLVDHVRWDIEEDLSRIVGDVAAHTLCRASRRFAQELREFVSMRLDARTDVVPS